jgi:hypothetical protein
MIDELAKAGAPAIVLVVYQDEIPKIFSVASSHPILSSTQVTWIGVDAWMDVTLNTLLAPSGIIGLAPNHENGNMTTQYLDLWKSLDPLVYVDSNGDRDDVGTYSLQAADAMFALAFAYEYSLHDNTGLTGSSLRSYIFTSLISQVSFQGVSGHIDFSASGDLIDPIFRITRYSGNVNGVDQWSDIGTVDVNGVRDINSSALVWPDGSIGVTSSYSKQLKPYCGAGEEPIVASDGISTCTPCEVGYYKPLPGTDSCLTCPEGADCNDVGITIPCILEGYWRAQPSDPNDLSNFKKYSIYICDYSEVCRGGCQLNQSCRHDRKQSSPVCGVCEEGYYMSDGECYSCQSNQSENHVIQTIIYTLVGFGSLFLLFSVLVLALTFNLASTQSPTSLSSSNPTLLTSSSSSSMDPDSAFPSLSESELTSSGNKIRRSSLATLQIMSRSVSKSILSPAIAMLTHQDNQRKVKKVIKGSGMTAKITLSFLQVMTGSFYMLNLDLPNYFRVFFNGIRINPFRPIQASFSCESGSSSSSASDHSIHPFYLGTIFCVVMPFLFILLLIIASFFAWHFFLFLTRYKLKENDDVGERIKHERERKRQWKRLRDLTVKIYFWFCLISYPPLSQRILSYYNCRSLGVTGTYLRADYTVSCESQSYQFYFFIALFGTFLVPIGVPVLFSLVVHYRNHPLLLHPSLLLHDNFVTEWRYFEAYDLIRKLTLTSLVVYVAPPDTASQCLFLLLVDGTALLLLAYSRPYANSNDDFLSAVLVSIECISFFVAIVIVSGIASQDHYNLPTLYNTLFVLILFSMACIVPCTLAMKFKAVSTRVDYLMEIIFQKSEDYGLSLPALTRLDSRRRMLDEVEGMRESMMHEMRSSLSDLAQIELYRHSSGDEEDRNGGGGGGDGPEDQDDEESNSISMIQLPRRHSARNPIHRTGLLGTKNPKEILMKKRESYERKKGGLAVVRESDEIASSISTDQKEVCLNGNDDESIKIPSRPLSMP